MGIEGLWYGTAAGYTVMVALLLVYCHRIDWQMQAQLAVARSVTTNDDKEVQAAENVEEEEAKEDAPLIAQPS